ncbi:MAG: hypothetical protein ACI832_001351 [Rheinheimera aquimaris]|jgi:hypothetical protein
MTAYPTRPAQKWQFYEYSQQLCPGFSSGYPALSAKTPLSLILNLSLSTGARYALYQPE